MSVPAPSLPLPAPAPRSRGAAPKPASARRSVSAAKTAARPARRGWRHPTFLLFAAVVVSVMVMGLVALNALLVQTTYRMQTVRQEVSDLSDQQVQLTDQVARKSSPETVAKWARLHGMTSPLPGDTVILPVPGVTSAPDASAGAGG